MGRVEKILDTLKLVKLDGVVAAVWKEVSGTKKRNAIY